MVWVRAVKEVMSFGEFCYIHANDGLIIKSQIFQCSRRTVAIISMYLELPSLFQAVSLESICLLLQLDILNVTDAQKIKVYGLRGL